MLLSFIYLYDYSEICVTIHERLLVIPCTILGFPSFLCECKYVGRNTLNLEFVRFYLIKFHSQSLLDILEYHLYSFR